VQSKYSGQNGHTLSDLVAANTLKPFGRVTVTGRFGVVWVPGFWI
jgi:hypothetical protein